MLSAWLILKLVVNENTQMISSCQLIPIKNVRGQHAKTKLFLYDVMMTITPACELKLPRNNVNNM